MLTLSYQTYQDVPQLSRVLAVIYETLRLFPPVSLISADFSRHLVKYNDC